MLLNLCYSVLIVNLTLLVTGAVCGALYVLASVIKEEIKDKRR